MSFVGRNFAQSPNIYHHGIKCPAQDVSYFASLLDPTTDPTKPLDCIQQREWSVDRTDEVLRSKLTETAHPPVEAGDDTLEWTQLHGLFRSRVQFLEENGDRRLKYQCFQTVRGMRVFFLIAGIILLTAGILGGLLYVNFGRIQFGDVATLYGSDFSTGFVALFTVGLAYIAYYYHGPSPPFATAGLEPRYTTYSVLYFVFAIYFISLSTVSILPGFDEWVQILIIVVVIFTFLVHHFACGTFPQLRGQKFNHLNAAKPLIETPQPHFSIAVIAVLPTFLTLLGASVQGNFPTTPIGVDPLSLWLLANIIFPVCLLALYCYWCYSIFKRIEIRRIDPFQSWGGRLVVGGGFLAINFLTITFSNAIFSTLAAILYPALYRVDIPASIAGGRTMMALIGGLGGVGIATGYAQTVLQNRDHKIATYSNRFLAGFNYLVLLCLFVVIGIVVTILLWVGIGTQPAFFDIPILNLRIHHEEFHLLADVFGSQIIGAIAHRFSYFSIALPIFLIAGLWAVHINRQVVGSLTATASEVLEDVDHVPDSIDIRVVEKPIIAQANGRLFRRNRIEISRRFRDAVAESAAAEDFPDGITADDVISALAAHELYHLQNRDHFVSIIAAVSSVLVGGQNVVLAFYNLAESERAADRKAAEVTSEEALRNALSIAIEIESDDKISQQLDGPALLSETLQLPTELPDSLSEQTPREVIKRVFQGTHWLLLMPYHLLFGSIIYDATHLGYEDRQTILNLESEIYSFIIQRSELREQSLPTDYQYITPVERDVIYAKFTDHGATREQIDAVIEALEAEGAIRPVSAGYLQVIA